MPPPGRRAVLATGASLVSAGLLAGCIGDSAEYGAEWEDVDRIRLAATGEHWEGRAPEVIVDSRNPSLLLVEGREYVIEWVNEDGHEHVLEILSGTDEVLAESEALAERNRSVEFTVQARATLDTYRSRMLSATMVGDIEIFQP